MEAAMKAIDLENRYVYKGSHTIPPCSKHVYWNVLSTVYKIHSKHVNAFAKKLKSSEIETEGKEGNWREIQTGFNADVYYI